MSGVDSGGSELVDAVVIGGGMAGLSAADFLVGRGRSVTLLEAGPDLGGLARAIRIDGEPVEAYYHHVFPQDAETLELLERLGMSERLEWRQGRMGILHAGRAYPFDGPQDILRFSPLSLTSRLRLAVGAASLLLARDPRRLDTTTVGVGGPDAFGRQGYDLVWRPLLEAKFGPAAEWVPMAWLAARIRQRARARRATGDRLGYVRGSIGAVVDAYAADVTRRGASVELSSKVTRLERRAGVWEVAGDTPAGPRTWRARAVIACLSGPVLDRLAVLPEPYGNAIRAVGYRGVVCALVELERSLGRAYWTNVTDKLGLGCVALIEHTNFVPAERYGGTHLLYLAHYVDGSDHAWIASPDELLAAVEPALIQLRPGYTRDWVREVHVTRDPFAQPIPQVGGPMPSLPIETGAPGLIHASLAHVYPEDRGVSLALRLGRRAAEAAQAFLSRRRVSLPEQRVDEAVLSSRT